MKVVECGILCAVVGFSNAGLSAKAKTIDGVAQWPYKALAQAFEVIPRTLAQNCGADTVRLLTELRVWCFVVLCGCPSMIKRLNVWFLWLWQALKAGGANPMMGIDGNRGVIADMAALQIWDTFAVKVQTIKTAIEVRAVLCRLCDA